jgi:hypothetical protein
MHTNCKFTQYIIHINILCIINFLEVEKLKKLFLFIFTLAFIFSFDIRALADEGHSNDPNVKQAVENLENGSTDGHDAVSGEDDATMNHDSGSEMEGMDMEAESGGEDHHAAVVEAPPNYKVLGTFGAVNLLFIIIGVWNKWFRRKGDLNNGNA